MPTDAKEHIRDKLRCRPTAAVASAPWECRYFSLSQVFVGLKCAQASRVSVYLSAFTFLSVVFIDFFASLLFCFLDEAGVFVGSSIVVPLVFPLLFFFFRVYPVHSFFVLFSFYPFFSFFFFCIYYEFTLAEDMCVHFPLLLISLSFSGGFLVKEVFSFLNEPFGRSGYIPCRIGKDGGFIQRDRSFHLPRINLAKAGRCVTDWYP